LTSLNLGESVHFCLKAGGWRTELKVVEQICLLGGIYGLRIVYFRRDNLSLNPTKWGVCYFQLRGAKAKTLPGQIDCLLQRRMPRVESFGKLENKMSKLPC